MIPKTIHYCWFGKNKKNEKIEKCISSWRKIAPDFSIVEWNEENFEYKNHPFTNRMYNEKKWAFVSDYVRLYALYEYGGFYLDTDMLLIKDLKSLLENECILGKEDENIISAGMIASIPKHSFILECKKYYDTHSGEINTIPRILTKVFNEYKDKNNIKILPSKIFYPFDSEHIKEFHGQKLDEEIIGVHLWNYSWGSPLNKFFKKIGIYNFGKKVTEIIGIKKIIKKLLGFI